MELSTDVTLLVLLAALLHATWNAIVKSSPGKLFDTVAITTGAAVICVVAMPFTAWPAPAAWPWLGWSVALHTAYFLTLSAAYRWADLSVAYPLMRGLAPMIVALAGLIALDDALTGAMWAGIGLISSGILLPAFFRRGAPFARKGTAFALLNALIIASYTLVDGVGTRLSGNAIGYCVWLFMLNAVPILAVAALVDGRGALRHAGRRWKQGMAGSFFLVGAYGIVLWAMTQAPVAAVAALRETSVVIAALIGAFFFREPLGVVRIIGAVLVAVGIFALRS